MLQKRACRFCVFSLLFLAAGCGQVQRTAPAPSIPAVTVSPNAVTFPAITQGATSNPIALTVTNSGNAPLNISSVATAGANTADFTTTNACTGAVPVLATCTISVTFKPTASGQRSETITLTDNSPDSPQVINVSGTANPISVNIAASSVALATGQSLSFTASDNDADDTLLWSVSSAGGAPAGTIDSSGHYTAPSGPQSALVTVTATSSTDNSKSDFATVYVVAPGSFTTTNNVQVAQYTVSAPSSATVSVQFGLDTSYGLTTWTQPTPPTGGPVSLFVAGMKQTTPYHMRGVVQFPDGTQFLDADQTFTTGTLPANITPAITTATTAGMTPQPGVELLDLVQIGAATNQAPVGVTDLSGNVIWTYNPTGLPALVIPNPIKLSANGHFLINFGGGAPDGINSILQEVDLSGTVLWQMTAADLNASLTAATCTGCNITVVGTHHDFAILPNGHLVVIAATQQVVSGTTVTGDVLIDVGDIENVGGNNPNHKPQPVWLWNEFDHLDINRRPYSYPDWTHTNAIIYSKDDGNLIISIRHQNWLVKIDYNNGAGAGDILWRLGYQGDFTLMNADGTPDTTNTDWFFAQHGPSFVSSNTTGKFSLVLFDNGDDRGMAVPVTGGTCGVSGQPACFSTVPIFDIDETAKTATFSFHQTTPDYSFFGGSSDILKNGNVEYDECASTLLPANNAKILEVTKASPPQTVWQMNITGQYAYRGMRLPSLYPGVQW